MKLINEHQQEKIRYRYQLASSAILATVLVSITALIGSPLAQGFAERIGV